MSRTIRMTATRSAEGVVLGAPPRRTERTALLEADGALLLWDAVGADADAGSDAASSAAAPASAEVDPDAGSLPAAIVWDVRRAAAWAWEIYGREVTAALLRVAEAEAEGSAEDDSISFVAEPGPSAEPARLAARAAWARAWWPASALAAIPPLDPRLLALEGGAALADIAHLLDDEDAGERALAAALVAAERLVPAPSGHGGVGNGADDENVAGVAELVARVREAADDLGIRADDARAEAHAAESLVSAGRGDYALAAGEAGTTSPGGGRGVVVASGTAGLDLAALAPSTVDPAAEARWSIVRDGDGTTLGVFVDRAPAHPADPIAPEPLEAVFAGVRVRLVPARSVFAGSVPVPATILLTRPEQRTLEVCSPGYGPADARAAAGRSAPPVDATALVDAVRRLLDRAHVRDAAPSGPAPLLAETDAALRA